MNLCDKLDQFSKGQVRRWFIYIAALFEMFWFGGYYYGYNALVGPYKELKVFHYVCNSTEVTCDAQDQMFNYTFIVWLVTQMCLITAAGYIMDRMGLRTLKLIAMGLYSIGSLMFAFTDESTSALLFPAGIFVALGSTSSLICDHQISSKFPKLQGFAISLLSGAFDSSTLLTFIIAKTVDRISLRTSFIIVAIGSLIYGTMLALFGLTQWASDMRLAESEDEGAEKKKMEVLESEKAIHAEADIDERYQTYLKEHYPTFKRCIISLPFALITLWFMFGLLRFSFFLKEITAHLKFLYGDDEEKVNPLRSASSVLLMAGFLISPISGFILDSSRAFFRRRILRELRSSDGQLSDRKLYWLHLRGIAPAFLVMAVSALIMSVMNFIRSPIAYYCSFLFFVILRSLLFSASVTFVLVAFPQQMFGTVNGLVNLIGGVFTNVEYAMVLLNFTTGNWVATAISCVLFITPVFILVKPL